MVTAIAILVSVSFCMAQNSVTGVISDRNDRPVQGATVRIKGTTLTTFSAADGRYAITVPNNETVLEFLFDGNIMREVFVSDQRVIDVRIEINFRPPAQQAITINRQPEARTNVTAGYIADNISVEARATDNTTLSYQWYRSTALSSSGGSRIPGATGATFAIPTTLRAGTYYYYCEIRTTGRVTPVRSNVATVTVSELLPGMLSVSGRSFYLASQKLLNDLEQIGDRAYETNKPLTTAELQVLMANATTAWQMYNRGVKRNRSGNVWMISGGSLLAGGLFILTTQPFEKRYEYTGYGPYNDQNRYVYYGYTTEPSIKTGTLFAVTGGAMFITGMIMKSNSKKFLRQSARSYNTGMGLTKVEYDFNFTGNGVRLAIRF